MPLAHLNGEDREVFEGVWKLAYCRKVKIAAIALLTFASGLASCWHVASGNLPRKECGSQALNCNAAYLFLFYFILIFIKTHEVIWAPAAHTYKFQKCFYPSLTIKMQ